MNALTQIFEGQKASFYASEHETGKAVFKAIQNKSGPVPSLIRKALMALEYVQEDDSVCECQCGAFYHEDDMVTGRDGTHYCHDDCRDNNETWDDHVRFYSKPR